MPASGCRSAVFAPKPPSAGHDTTKGNRGFSGAAAAAMASGGTGRRGGKRRVVLVVVDVVVVVGGFGGHGAIHA